VGDPELEKPHLRVTKRCLTEDLGVNTAALDLPVERQADEIPIVRAFVERRSQRPVGQEIITGLTSKIVAFSLHSGEDRGATWHDEEAGIVWLLAARFHRSGKPEDAYPYFRELDAINRLLPTADDYVALARSIAPTLAKSLLEEVPGIKDEALSNPEVVVEARLGGRIGVRLVYEGPEPYILTVAISQHLRPGELEIPADWLAMVAAAFFQLTPFERLEMTSDLGGDQLRSDEIGFCDFYRG
jgi:hypothetical protein